MAKNTSVQPYPRILDEDDRFHGFLNEAELAQHKQKITLETLKSVISSAIEEANKKSSREILSIYESMTDDEKKRIYAKEGKELFKYFIKYCGDPASTAFECLGQSYVEVGREQFRNRTLQKQRMNSGWRYQFIAKDCALKSKRFLTVSDIGTSEADFNAVIGIIAGGELNIYVSVKNRMNTMGGQDWPKAIQALENMAKNDKNRKGPYICVFGIAMDRGHRSIKKSALTKQPYSFNTEVWLSDFFWPFFSNYSYQEIMDAVLDVLMTKNHDSENRKVDVAVPDELLESFGNSCREKGLIDENGLFNDPKKLVSLFCNK